MGMVGLNPSESHRLALSGGAGFSCRFVGKT